MSLRLRIILLLFAVLAPAAITAVLAVTYVQMKERESFTQTVQETARALALVVDAEMVADAVVWRRWPPVRLWRWVTMSASPGNCAS